MKVNKTVVNSIIGFSLIAIGTLPMLAFSMWQLNMLTSPMVDGDIAQSIGVFEGIAARGYASFREMPWTVNIDLFPHMTAGEAYDNLMIVNLASWFPLVVGAFLLHNPLVVASKKLVSKLRSMRQ